MQESYPHDIRRFADGEAVPPGYVELTEEEFEELDAMTPDWRRAWLENHKERTLNGKLMDELNKKPELEPHEQFDADERAEEQRDLRREQTRGDEAPPRRQPFFPPDQSEQRHRANRRIQGR